MKTGPMSPKVHGVFDYLFAALLLLAPAIFGFAGTPATLSYILGIGMAGMSLVTAYPLSIAKVVPFSAHGIAELGVGALMVILAAFAGWAGAARGFYLIAGLGVAVLFLVTNYRAAERPAGARAPVRTRA
jgi:hypothetical protein